ncbi:MAG: hypothetical protein HY364_03685 [Candidatus Aenigmarchaeota archaeon]|nr:hypothetical protein [Candidatus Aenigmarchaeota archaeon]
MMNRAISAAAIVIALGIMMFYFGSQNKTSGIVGEVHEHADFRVYINNEPYNFSQEKYMSTDSKTLSNFMHLHDMEGSVIHKHAEGITLGFFFRSLNMNFNSTCFALDNGSSYCNTDSSRLRMFINGQQSNAYGEYDLKDLDKILITYGSAVQDTTIQINSVADNACIYSGKCPQRGLPPDEASCFSGTGCSVEGA